MNDDPDYSMGDIRTPVTARGCDTLKKEFEQKNSQRPKKDNKAVDEELYAQRFYRVSYLPK